MPWHFLSQLEVKMETNPEDLKKRGDAYEAKCEYDKAIADYTAALNIDPNDYECLKKRGNAYFFGECGDDLAIADYTAAIKIKPDYFDALRNRAIVYCNKCEYDLEIADYTQALNIKPDDIYCLINRGAAYYQKKDYDNAIADYKIVLKLEPGNDSAKEKLAEIAELTKDNELGNDYEALRQRAMEYNQKGEYDKAIAEYTASLKIKPDFHRTFCGRGNAYRCKEDYDKAIADYDEAIRIKPDYDIAFHMRGIAYKEKKDYDKAIADFTAAIGIQSDNPDYSSSRGLAYKGKKDYDAMIADFTKVIEIRAKNGKSEYCNDFYWRGYAYYQKDKNDNAIADLTKAIGLRKKEDKDDYFYRGLAYKDKNDYDAAIKDFTKCIEIRAKTGDGEWHNDFYNRGWAYYQKNDCDKAIEDFKTALRLEPSNAKAKEKLGNIARNFEKLAKELKERGCQFNGFDDDRDYNGEAIENLTKSITLKKECRLSGVDSTYALRSDVYCYLCDYDNAIADLTKAIEQEKADGSTLSIDEYYGKRGQVYYKKKDYDNAIADFNSALEIFPFNEENKKNLKLCCEKRDFWLTFKNEEVCLAALKKSSISFSDLPVNLKTEKVCLEAVSQNLNLIELVPEDLKETVAQKLGYPSIYAIKAKLNDMQNQKMADSLARIKQAKRERKEREEREAAQEQAIALARSFSGGSRSSSSQQETVWRCTSCGKRERSVGKPEIRGSWSDMMTEERHCAFHSWEPVN